MNVMESKRKVLSLIFPLKSRRQASDSYVGKSKPRVFCSKLKKIMTLSLSLEFSGGAELLCGNVKKHAVQLPEHDSVWTVGKLLCWIRDNIVQERPELFMQGETVRPGILVLINDADWELMGELDYQLEDKDKLVFISTLHGG